MSKKYRVHRKIMVNAIIEVEADDKEGAYYASQDFCELDSFVGNGRTHGALIGTTHENVTLEASYEPEEDEDFESKVDEID